MSNISTGGLSAVSINAKTLTGSSYTVSGADNASMLITTGSPYTISFPTSPNLPAGWWCIISNQSLGNLSFSGLGNPGFGIAFGVSLIVVSTGSGYLYSEMFQNPMAAVGDMVCGSTGGGAVQVAGNTTTTRKFLRQTGTGGGSATPAWDTIAAGDVPLSANMLAQMWFGGV